MSTEARVTTIEVKTLDQRLREGIAEEVDRIDGLAEDARYQGDHLREYQLSSIARRLRKLATAAGDGA